MIRISGRDKRLFEMLSRYEVMSSRQIRKTVFSEVPETNYFRRMRQLEKVKMIRRIGPMLDHSYAWLLAPKRKERMGFGENDLYKNRLTLEHDVTLTQVRMVLDSIGPGKNLITESQLRRRDRDQNSRYGDRNKWIVVPDALIPVMIGERTEVFGKPDDFVLCREDGGSTDSCTLRRQHVQVCRLAGLREIRVHDLRHTFASHFVMNGGSLNDLQALLGHSSPVMTQRYAHLAPGYLESKAQLVRFGKFGANVCALKAVR